MPLCLRYTNSAERPREKGAGGLEIKSEKKKRRRRRRRRTILVSRMATRGGRDLDSPPFQGQFSGKKQVGFCGPRDSTNKKPLLILENVYLENVYSPCS